MTQPASTSTAVRPGPIHQLGIARLFANLSKQERLYAHHMSRASWWGTRIILRQTSPEAIDIFDWIMSLYRLCQGDWAKLGQENDIAESDVEAFLNYAACFLSNVGNYYGSGDQKFTPAVSSDVLKKLCRGHIDEDTRKAITTVPPYSLGFPSENAQSTYYPGLTSLTKDEITNVSHLMESQGILPENTRLSKDEGEMNDVVYKILQASVATGSRNTLPSSQSSQTDIRLSIKQGDHRYELEKICQELQLAIQYAANDAQRRTLALYIQSFETGDLESYRDALRLWVRDLTPTVEHIIGFVEPYRDPYGTRAEFEGLVAIADPEETKVLQKLVDMSDLFIKRLPWCGGNQENNGKAPFEKSLFEPPDFSSIHVIAYCSSIIFPGINLPNYNDIRQDDGFKNVIIANRMAAEADTSSPSPFVADEEAETFSKHKFSAYYIWVVLHELVGHGTGKMLRELHDGTFNFNIDNRPLNPLTQKPVDKWYKPGQTWTGQFKDLATTVDECRAELVGAYLMDNKELLSIFGFTDTSEIKPEDLTYNTYMQLAIDGLRGLQNFNVDNMTWGQAHSRAHFATLKCLLRDGKGSVKVDFDPEGRKLTVRVDRSNIIPYAKAALEGMLLHLHMYRSTADVESCREYYEDLSRVEGEYLEWRDIVIASQQPKFVFVQPNTFLEDGDVRLKEYEATPAGVIQSWAERKV